LPCFYSGILFVLGIAYLVLLSNQNFSRKNFIDENALMAGLVRREFADMASIKEYAKHLKKEVQEE